MGTFLVYILKSAACLAVFYLFYKLLMSRDTFHRFNRFALLGLLVLSSLLPLVEASVNSPAAVQETMLTLEQLLLMADIQPEGESMAAATPSATVLWLRAALLVYLTGIVFFIVRNLCSLARLDRLIRQANGKLWTAISLTGKRKMYGWWYTITTLLLSAGCTGS